MVFWEVTRAFLSSSQVVGNVYSVQLPRFIRCYSVVSVLWLVA